MKEAPEAIYLIADGYADFYTDETYSKWDDKKHRDDDVKYIRADLVPAPEWVSVEDFNGESGEYWCECMMYDEPENRKEFHHATYDKELKYNDKFYIKDEYAGFVTRVFNLKLPTTPLKEAAND